MASPVAHCKLVTEWHCTDVSCYLLSFPLVLDYFANYPIDGASDQLGNHVDAESRGGGGGVRLGINLARMCVSKSEGYGSLFSVK